MMRGLSMNLASEAEAHDVRAMYPKTEVTSMTK